MTQSNFNLPNTDGATFRSNNNTAHQAHATWSSGSTAPSTTYPYQVWVDTANQLLKRRNSANTAWITEGRLDGTNPLALEAGFREPIATLSDLQAVSTADAADFPVRYMRGRTSDNDGGEGVFVWDGSDLSTEVGNDEVTASEGDGGIYVAPSSDKTGASGAWMRQFTGEYLHVRWYGAVLDGSTDDETAITQADSQGPTLIDGPAKMANAITWTNFAKFTPGASMTVDSGTNDYAAGCEGAYSRRNNLFVEVDPSNPAPFVDAQEALANVLTAGTLRIVNDWDISTHGQIDLTRPITIEGVGSQTGFNTSTSDFGTTIINTSGSPAAFVIRFTGSNPRDYHPIVRDISIRHHGGNSAIIVDDATWAHIERVNIDCEATGFGGVRCDNDSFFLRVRDCSITDFVTFGALIDGTGFDHIVDDCQITSSNNGATAGVEVRRPFVIVRGGQINTDNNGVRFNNQSGNNLIGGVVQDMSCERATAVAFTGADQWVSCYVVRPRMALGNVSLGVLFDSASDSYLVDPMVNNPNAGGTLVEYTANSARCGMEGSYNAGRSPVTVASGAVSPHHFIKLIAADGIISNITTDSNLFVHVLGREDNNARPAWHDGSNWYQASSTTFTP